MKAWKFLEIQQTWGICVQRFQCRCHSRSPLLLNADRRKSSSHSSFIKTWKTKQNIGGILKVSFHVKHDQPHFCSFCSQTLHTATRVCSCLVFAATRWMIWDITRFFSSLNHKFPAGVCASVVTDSAAFPLRVCETIKRSAEWLERKNQNASRWNKRLMPLKLR